MKVIFIKKEPEKKVIRILVIYFDIISVLIQMATIYFYLNSKSDWSDKLKNDLQSVVQEMAC